MIRILQVVGRMQRGGIETWLMHVLRHVDRQQFHMDFLVDTEQHCAYDDEIRSLGSAVIPCLMPNKPLVFARNFNKAFDQYGPYDVVHSHIHNYSGYILRLAKQRGVVTRIAHSHNDTSSVRARAKLPRRLYLALTERWINVYTTRGFAASKKAGAALFGPNWECDPRYGVLYCGIDLEPFHVPVDREGVRAELGIAPDAVVIGHVGRFEAQKNHSFLVDIGAELIKRNEKVRVLLVGDGPQRPMIEQKVAAMGLQRYFIFAGLRSDVPTLLKGSMDAFLLPSLFEGLPLVGIEAQAAGLPIFLSDTITAELRSAPELFYQLSLADSASVWANTILQTISQIDPSMRENGLKAVENSPFNIEISLKQLEAAYRSL